MSSNQFCEHKLSSMESATKAEADAAAVQNSNRIFPRKILEFLQNKNGDISRVENEAAVGSTSDKLKLNWKVVTSSDWFLLQILIFSILPTSFSSKYLIVFISM